MSELTDLTIAEARKGLRQKSFSARELAQAHVEAIEAANTALNAYVLPTPERALEMAAASDARLAKGEGGALEGIPLGIKDLFCTKDVRSTACSHILDGFTPTYESTVTANLWAEGAVMLGKLNNDEFAMGSSNETSYYGPKTVYHLGDTAIFSDMALINEIYAPQIGFVPIGDRYTMGARTAALACKRFFDFELIVPCHYGTFPVLDQTADKFVAEMGDNIVLVPEVGVPFEV